MKTLGLDEPTLRQMERDFINSHLDRFDFNIKNSPKSALTPLEQLLNEGTGPGIFFQPNKPLPIEKGVSLSLVNEYRYDQIHEFLLAAEEDDFWFMKAQLIPLTQKHVLSQDPLATFQIRNIKNLHNQEIPIPKDIWQLIVIKLNNARVHLAKTLIKIDPVTTRAA